MTAPRAIHPGTTYFVTRRTTRRTFLFRPDENGAVQGLFAWCLAVVAAKHGIVIHAVAVMSTHYHIVLSDTRGVLPAFLQEFHTLLARATKRLRGGWPEEVFNKAQTSAVVLETPKAIADKIGYVIANAVKAGAVRYAHQWPGLLTLPQHIGRHAIRTALPDVYFDAKNASWPSEAELKTVLPAQLVTSCGGEDNARTAIRDAAARHEREARDARRHAQLGFVGRARVLRVPFTTTSISDERQGDRNPSFATAGDQEAATRAATRIRTFRADHRAALLRWRVGDRSVLFPRGTWAMRVRHGVPVVPDD